MTSWPQPTRKNHEAFCQVEEWRRVREARGRTGTHHVTCEVDLVDGRMLRTRVSHPVNRTGCGQSMRKHILRDQLEVDEPTFWSCVQDGVKPARGTPGSPVAAMPADLVYMLITRIGLAESEVAGMSKDEAVARLQRRWTEGS